MGTTFHRKMPASHMNAVMPLPLSPSARRSWKYPEDMSAVKKFLHPFLSPERMVNGHFCFAGMRLKMCFILL